MMQSFFSTGLGKFLLVKTNELLNVVEELVPEESQQQQQPVGQTRARGQHKSIMKSSRVRRMSRSCSDLPELKTLTRTRSTRRTKSVSFKSTPDVAFFTRESTTDLAEMRMVPLPGFISRRKLAIMVTRRRVRAVCSSPALRLS